MTKSFANRRASDVPARILIIDDSDRDRSINASLLRGSTNWIRFASAAGEAIELSRDWQPDLVLLDIMMPEVDGYEVCRQIRSDPATADLRVFMLTSLDDSESRVRSFHAGADDFLTKPVNRVETLARIQSIARLNRYRALIGFHRELAKTKVAVDVEFLQLEGLEDHFAEAVDQLDMWFQPIVTVSEDAFELFAYESLMRSSRSPFQNPMAMLAAATSLGQMPRLSGAIRRRVVSCSAHLDSQLFVNLSVSELLDESLYESEDSLASLADRVILEVTEHEPIGNLSDLKRKIARLRELGYRIAVDDLGGGYSSLQSMVVLDPEFAKVDRSLITGIDDDLRKQTVVASIVALCRDLGIELIVEGIETEEERSTLLGLGCGLMQGFLFGRPQPITSD